MNKMPEVLAPAGSLEKLKVAILYGANAVYLGGEKFGLRAAAENFTMSELEEGLRFAHQRGAKVYVVLNSFPHDKDIAEIPDFILSLEAMGVDAFIVSDLGVVTTIKKLTDIPIHLSTQASCLNVYSAKLWKKMGVSRVIVGRELSIEESSLIKEQTGLEVEMFIHGSMCMAYSGNCVISNYTQGRDSNRGGCAHSCRFEYGIELENSAQRFTTTFMSSKDLNGIKLLPQFIKHSIDSIKVEGRMKSQLYAATMSKVYSEALKSFQEVGMVKPQQLDYWYKELEKVPHRSYSEASLMEPADSSSIFDERENQEDEYTMAAVVLEVVPNHSIILEIRNAFNLGDTLEFLVFDGPTVTYVVNEMTSLDLRPVERTKPNTLVRIPFMDGVEELNIVRRRITP